MEWPPTHLALLPPSNLSPSVLLAPATSLVQNNLGGEDSQMPGVQDGVGLPAQHPGLTRTPDPGCSNSSRDSVVCPGAWGTEAQRDSHLRAHPSAV